MKDCVLFVDDEENILLSIHRLMDEWLEDRNCVMETASSVAQALAKLVAAPERYAVVVSDLKMPNQVGTVLLTEVQSRWPEISTILLTGYAEIEEIKKAIKSGIVAFIQKPWDPDLVKAEVGKALELANLRRKNREYLQTMINEIKWSRMIHQTILMDESSSSTESPFGVAYRPAQGVIEGGGDFFQVLWNNAASTGICLGTIDVKGAQSTYFALLIRDLLKKLIPRSGQGAGLSPAKILGALNHAIMDGQMVLPGCFLTLTICVTDAANDRIVMGSAGGESFFMVKNGTSQEHHLPSPGLGYRDGIIYQDRVFPFMEGTYMALASRPLVSDSELRGKFEAALARPVAYPIVPKIFAEKILTEVLGAMVLGLDATLIVLDRAGF